MTIEWSPQQEAAIDEVGRWLASGHDQVFKFFGVAGTGKTTMIVHLAKSVKGNVLYAAYTGKAAHVMQQRGCTNASTLHSLIYKPTEKSKDQLHAIEEDIMIATKAIVDDHGGESESPECKKALEESGLLRRLRQELRDEMAGLKRPAFTLNPDSPLQDADLLVVDECSMVDERMGEDLLSFGVKVLVMGDPAQLPPVRGTGYFTQGQPQVMLTEVHRQARDNPIIRLATDVRQGRALQLGQYGESRVMLAKDGYPELYSEHDQVICGRENPPKSAGGGVHRRQLNARIRQLLGRTNPYPEPGDRLICLRNNSEQGLLNGGQWDVVGAQGDHDVQVLDIKDEKNQLTVSAHSKIFRGEEMQFWEMDSAEHFDYGYAMTGHKSQGSQWPRVLVFDQSHVFRENARRWLYTAITRASEKVTVVQ